MKVWANLFIQRAVKPIHSWMGYKAPSEYIDFLLLNE